MSGMERINNAVRELLSYADGFELDNRSDAQLLEEFSEYVRLIPFDAQGHSWDDFFFMAGITPDVLADLSSGRVAADGTLLPQQAFLIAFLKLVRTPRALLNFLPLAHRELYYRTLLGLSERTAKPDSVILSLAPSKTEQTCFVPAGTLFDAGKDQSGDTLQYALDQSILVNRCVWTDLRWVQPAKSGASTASLVFDQQQADWPAEGVLLFNPQTASQPVVTGRLVASPALAMTGGKCTYTLNFGSTTVNSADLSVAQISSGSKWLNLTLPDQPTTAVTLVLSINSVDAVSAPQGLDGITLDTPVIKLGREDGQPVPSITSLDVQIDGNTNVLYSTDSGVGRLSTLSYPFGTAPVVGRGFNLVSSDWCTKVDGASFTITLSPQWIGLPTVSFKDWYSGYNAGLPPADNSAFTVQAWWMSADGTSMPLGIAIDNASLQSLFAKDGVPVGVALSIVLPSALPSAIARPSNPCDWPSWIRLELTPLDFGHQTYQTLVGTGASLNPPYTPQVTAMQVSYAIQTAEYDQYVLTPFGYAADGTAADDPKQYYLYAGLTGGTPGETLSLYWQLQSPQSLAPAWEYLSQSNTWMSLDSTLTDGTQGLEQSGFWTTTLPQDAANDATGMPEGRYWLRAKMQNAIVPMGKTGIGTAPNGYVWLQGLAANSMSATLDIAGTVSPQHFLAPLPAKTITRPVTPVEGLGTVSQPWPSWGGQAAELPAQFFIRTAQRLSHRNRALTWQDMATLLRSRYSSIYNVITPPVAQMTLLPAATTQTLVVIPDNAWRDNQDPLRPLFSQSHLDEMAVYLQGLASAWSSIKVVNPIYTNVDLVYDVSFNLNSDYADAQLRQALTLHYMPWVTGGLKGASAGNEIDYYGLIAFIQQQPYVTEVNSLKLNNAQATVQAALNEVLILNWPVAIGRASKAKSSKGQRRSV